MCVCVLCSCALKILYIPFYSIVFTGVYVWVFATDKMNNSRIFFSQFLLFILFCFVLVLGSMPMPIDIHTQTHFCINKPKCKKSLHTHTHTQPFTRRPLCASARARVWQSDNNGLNYHKPTIRWWRCPSRRDVVWRATAQLWSCVLGECVYGHVDTDIPFLVKCVISFPKI